MSSAMCRRYAGAPRAVAPAAAAPSRKQPNTFSKRSKPNDFRPRVRVPWRLPQRLCSAGRPAQRGQINSAQRTGWTEAEHRDATAADHAASHRWNLASAQRTDRFRGYAWTAPTWQPGAQPGDESNGFHFAE